MSYRHRVAVLLSVLWLIGLPIYVLVDTNQRASEILGSCMSVVNNIDWCLPGAGFMSPREMAHNLVARDRNTIVLWGLMVGGRSSVSGSFAVSPSLRCARYGGNFS
jgi:hypothetical protein